MLLLKFFGTWFSSLLSQNHCACIIIVDSYSGLPGLLSFNSESFPLWCVSLLIWTYLDWIYFSNYISHRANILQRNTRYIEMYNGKILGKIEFRNILLKLVEVWTYLSNYISHKANILQRNTRHIEIYGGNILDKLEFRNILLKLVEVHITILAYLLTKCSFLAILSPISPYL